MISYSKSTTVSKLLLSCVLPAAAVQYNGHDSGVVVGGIENSEFIPGGDISYESLSVSYFNTPMFTSYI